jgi:23S rRNA (cytosine1962-C5)-methyltransferase
MNRASIILKSGKDEAVLRQHPWVFSGAIKKMHGEPNEGDIVDVYNNKEQFLGCGHWQDGSIAVRIFSFDPIEPDYQFWKARLQQAYDMRTALGLTQSENTNVYRLVHAEGDSLPGLIIDFYNGAAVIQAHSIGMYLLRHDLSKALREIYGNNLHTVYAKCQESLPKNSNEEIINEFLFGNKESEIVLENGNQFEVNWVTGQKTGFFIDQRFNRQLVGQYSKNRNVLNTYCYTGGFSIYALQQGANLVHSVDSSAKAIDLTNNNVKINACDTNRHQAFAIDTMSFLQEMEQSYDLIILDPPAFAKHRDVRHQAVQGYKRLNTIALNKIAKGGILFTFSCSQVVDRRLFESTILAAAIQSGRKVKILHHLSQPADHPVSIYHPEGEYLKGLVLYVE